MVLFGRKANRSVGDSNPTMMQITEDTPPDMLAGAMDLTVHLPTGRTVKMSVERSTPMMDLLVQITTAHHLQHSGHILQALEMAPTSSSGHTDKILPYKPNTPIGALDTQHVKVIPKNRSIPVPKNVSVGHQPFESTFRLQVHLPRNQLYVIRVSQNVYLEDIMKKVCDEKNLDSVKYEFRHPGNLDEVLDPKLTLSDYQITEVYIVSKGTVGLTQAFSTSDIMALRKEEERKQLQARTGGGVFSLIFKRGKPSMGSGSLSSENRSISPSHSDDSRSVTPPAIQQQILPPVISTEPQQTTITEKPKPPQRKRRPAPKPPQQQQQQDNNNRKDSSDTAPSQISTVSDSNTSDLQQQQHNKKIDNNGLTICHSRNSSDSSGYHEPSVLSDNCNTSLPRRPKSTIINEVVNEEVQSSGEHSRNNGNLAKMATFSKSTTSITSRKKKAAPAPPPPPAVAAISKPRATENSVPSPEKPSPVVASPLLVEKQDSISTIPRESINSVQISSSRRQSDNSFIVENDYKKASESPRRSISSDLTVSSRKDSKTSIILDDKPSLDEPDNKLKSVESAIKYNAPPTQELLPSRLIEKEIQREPSPKSSPRTSLIPTPIIQETKQEIKQEPNKETDQKSERELVELESDWQYQLPLPPTAFRDTSPTNLTDVTNYDTITLQDFKDESSVITNPELFEKLRLVKESRSENDTNSDYNSIISEDEKPMLSKLTLENLEKRKSLVYNRELSTSLKVAQESSSSCVNSNNKIVDDESSKRSSVLSELEEAIQNGKTLNRQKTTTTIIDNTLPNFKISTYDKPKRKINIFEDDSVRSNAEATYKTNSFMELPTSSKTDQNFFGNSGNTQKTFFSAIGRSMENIPYRKASIEEQYDEDGFKKPQELNKFKLATKTNFYVKQHQSENVARSESFSMNHNVPNWKPHNPVQRSKSQVALNVKQDIKTDNDDSLTKSNSLFDVSGLQSLEVMRMIQTKLNTPHNSMEQLPEQETNVEESNQSLSQHSEPDSTTNNTKPYKYRGPPAINLSTWSERPKTKVSLKEDTDYKINTNNNIEIRHYKSQGDSNGVSIKINGTEPITTQQSGNVVIKIGESQAMPKTSDEFASRFVNNGITGGFRKPLANINKIEKAPRPHSIAFDSDFDISRVPIVRSVELKKTFKEPNNTSVTQIGSNNNNNNNSNNKYADIYRSSESVNEINTLKPQPQVPTKNSSVYLSSEPSIAKPVIRVNSFAQNRSTPVVMGFRGVEVGNDNTARSRKSWNVPSSYGTLPLKVTPETPVKSSTFVPNSNVPFSQLTLKRIESNKVPPSSTNNNSSDEVSNGNNNGITSSSGNVFRNIVLRNMSGQIKNNNNNNRHSTGSQFVAKNNFEMRPNRVAVESSTGAPPPPPIMPKVTKNITKKPLQMSAQPSSLDSRDELLNSIRNFGGAKGLRHVKA